MPDNVNILKICAVLAAGVIFVSAAAKYTESYAAETAAREKTLAEAVIQNQLRAELKKAEEHARIELEEQGQTLVTEVLETKPPVSVTAAPETVTENAVTEETAAVSEPEKDESVTEFTRGGLLPADRTGLPVRSMLGLSESEQARVTNFLIEHYFLDGYKYSAAETDPELKDKKRLAADMEACVVETLNMILNNVNTNDISAVLTADYGAMTDEIRKIRGDFEETYSAAYLHGVHFAELYDNSLKYFDRQIEALGRLDKLSAQYRETTNPLLALGLLTSGLNDVIIPEIMAVLEQSFDLVEASQEIFLEKTTGTRLLSREEVTDIILNPALVLDTNID